MIKSPFSTIALSVLMTFPLFSQAATLIANNEDKSEIAKPTDIYTNISASKNRTATVTGPTINGSGSNMNTVSATNNGIVNIGTDETVNVSLSNAASGQSNAYGTIKSESNSSINILGQNINLSGVLRVVYVNGSGHINVGNSNTEILDITSNAVGRYQSLNYGVAAMGSTDSLAEINLDGKMISISASNIGAVETVLNDAIHAENNAKVIIGSENTEKIQLISNGNAKSAAVSLVKGNAYNNESSVTLISKTIDLQSSGDGIYVGNNTSLSQAPENAAHVQLTADDISITADKNGIAAFSNGQVDVSGNLEIFADNVIAARGYSTININNTNSETNATVRLTGNIAFISGGAATGSGDILDANVNVNLTGESSFWTGNVYKAYSNDISEADREVSGLHVTLADGAQWNPTVITKQEDETGILEAQALNNLHFDGGVINLTQGKGQVVSIENTTGSGGTVNLLTTEAEDGTLETGTVNFGAVEGTPALAVNYTGITADDVKSGNLGDIKGGVTSTGGSFTQTRSVAQGAVKGAIIETYDENGEFVSRTAAENTRLDAYGSVAALSIMQWRHEMNDLTKRMGELRTSPEGIGSWARIYGSEQEYGSQNLTAKNTSVQIGADTDIGNGWKVGAAFTYTDGSADYDLGDADNKAYGLGVYGTWMAGNGQFVDLIAKYSRLDTDFKLEGMNGSSDNNAFSVSAEYGWHLRLGEFGFFEPEAEVTYGYIQGDEFHTSNGVEIDQNDFESLIGRIGFRTGFHFPKDKGLIYARVSGLHDFKGDFDSKATLMSDRSIYDNIGEDLGDTWVEFGIGANFNWTPNTYTYVDLERTNGGDVKENWRWNIGLRHVF